MLRFYIRQLRLHNSVTQMFTNIIATQKGEPFESTPLVREGQLSYVIITIAFRHIPKLYGRYNDARTEYIQGKTII